MQELYRKEFPLSIKGDNLTVSINGITVCDKIPLNKSLTIEEVVVLGELFETFDTGICIMAGKKKFIKNHVNPTVTVTI